MTDSVTVLLDLDGAPVDLLRVLVFHQPRSRRGPADAGFDSVKVKVKFGFGTHGSPSRRCSPRSMQLAPQHSLGGPSPVNRDDLRAELDVIVHQPVRLATMESGPGIVKLPSIHLGTRLPNGVDVRERGRVPRAGLVRVPRVADHIGRVRRVVVRRAAVPTRARRVGTGDRIRERTGAAQLGRVGRTRVCRGHTRRPARVR